MTKSKAQGHDESNLLWPPHEMAELMDTLAIAADRYHSSYSETAHLARHAAKTIRALEKALSASKGYLMNAKIDLETGATKRTAINTIEGGLKMIDTSLSPRGET